jgi:transcriptional regulator
MAGSDLFTGTLDILILKAVAWGPNHGYGIARWIRETTTETVIVQEGVLYPALHRLEKKGLIAQEWGTTETGREARYYSLTAGGRAHLKTETKRWSKFSAAINRALAPAT